MELVDLASRYRQFYAPAFVVKIQGKDLMRDHQVAVSQVEVDLALGAASHFSFTLVDCYSHALHKFVTANRGDLLDLLPFGAEVEIAMGYQDSMSMPCIVKGVITEISTNFAEGGSPEISVSGMDHGYLFTIGKYSRSWTKRKDSFVAAQIASFYTLGSVIEPTKVEHPQIEQNQMSDWDFLKTLADRNHYELYVDEESQLHFAPPNDKASDVVQLAYGKGLLSFKPEANLANQISRVEVYGWDQNSKKTIVGVASAGEESGRNGKSAGQFLDSIVRDQSKRPTLRLRQPVFTQAEANQRAKAALNEHAKQFLTGDGESIGLPELRPDRNVNLSELAKSFSKTYYIQQTTHKIDSNGYRTRFKVKETGL